MTTSDQAQMHRDVARSVLTDAAHLALGDPARAALFAEAQVHATLALSEEQRTFSILLAGGVHFDLTDRPRLELAVRLGLA